LPIAFNSHEEEVDPRPHRGAYLLFQIMLSNGATASLDIARVSKANLVHSGIELNWRNENGFNAMAGTVFFKVVERE